MSLNNATGTKQWCKGLGLDVRARLNQHGAYLNMKEKKIIITFIALLGLSSCDYFQDFVSPQNPGEAVVIARKSEIKLVASNDKFRFIPEQIVASPGQVLKLKVTNQLKTMPIIFSILKKDQNPIVNAYLGVQRGESKQWAPPKEHILFQSKLLTFNQTERFEVKLPLEPGNYAYISSYPGQVDDLKGFIRIEKKQD